MYKSSLLTILLVILSISIGAQNYYSIRISQNSTSLPISGIGKVFTPTLHPGINFEFDKKLKEKKKNQFRNSIGVGFFYHRFFQKSFQIYDVVKYQYSFNSRWSASAGIGGGYMHSFYNYGIFRINSDGAYERIAAWKGRPQYLIMLSFGAKLGLIRTNPEKIKLNFEVNPFLHGTFAKSYVPLVPYNSISIGASFQIKPKTK